MFLTEQRAAEILADVRHRRVVVFGDVMLDEFVWGDVTRISPEAPVPVVDVRRESVRLGGAANVVANLIALGADARVVGVIGDDAAGKRLCAELKEKGARDCESSLIVDRSRPSTVKTRIIAHNQLVVRADREQRAPVDMQIENEIVAELERALEDADALVVSDYDKGAVTPGALARVLPFAHERGIPALVDPKMRNFDVYRPATLVTPNHHEALRLAGIEEDAGNTDESTAEAARVLQKRLGGASVLITRGERGMMLLEERGDPVFVGTVAREVYDVTGAGDTVVATLAAALAARASLTEAAVLANHAAGIVVGKLGTATAYAGEILESINKNGESK
jgi:D-glycero-beta-D-manno-heptose-7-phosphate kinase